jgi:hypothetical protein
VDHKLLQITDKWLENIFTLDYSYPNPSKQVDYLVRFFKHPGKQIQLLSIDEEHYA